MSNVLWDFVEGIGVNPYPPNQAPPIIFTQIAIPETVELPCEKPDIEHVLSVMVDAQICSVRFVDTPTATSYEGQRLLGKKAIIELKLKQKVKYVADEPTQSVHASNTAIRKKRVPSRFPTLSPSCSTGPTARMARGFSGLSSTACPGACDTPLSSRRPMRGTWPAKDGQRKTSDSLSATLPACRGPASTGCPPSGLPVQALTKARLQ